ncbi:acyl-CoA carboxylase epsilon subunit, partial [Streptomyces sp. WAC06614]|uniref:acyl-CoA carboxylase epsilon subunit n=1 Tax=Streptomyces sp. WAC06614 TaxID=2487416 RepID=UPI00163BC7E7
INGRPTPEELAAVAALVAALTSRQADGDAPTAATDDPAADTAARWERPGLLPPASWQAPSAPRP